MTHVDAQSQQYTACKKLTFNKENVKIVWNILQYWKIIIDSENSRIFIRSYRHYTVLFVILAIHEILNEIHVTKCQLFSVPEVSI